MSCIHMEGVAEAGISAKTFLSLWQEGRLYGYNLSQIDSRWHRLPILFLGCWETRVEIKILSMLHFVTIRINVFGFLKQFLKIYFSFCLFLFTA